MLQARSIQNFWRNAVFHNLSCQVVQLSMSMPTKLFDSITLSSQRLSSQLASDPKIVIEEQLKAAIQLPPKKKWSSTAILEALEKTVGSTVTSDYTSLNGPHYVGGGSRDRKHRFDSQKHGVKAAEYIIDNYPQFFQHEWDSENVPLWLEKPDQIDSGKTLHTGEKVTLDQDKPLEISVESLKQLLNGNKMHAAVSMFKSLHKANHNLPSSICCQLLAYLAFYRENIEFYQALCDDPSTALDSSQKFGTEGQLLKEVFELIENPTTEQYCVMIRGLTMNNKFEDAGNLYEKRMVPAGLVPDLETFNHLILCVPTRQGTEIDIYVKKVCAAIEKAGLRPNHRTFINLARIRPNIPHYADALLRYWKALLGEMDYLGLEPCASVFNSMHRTIRGMYKMSPEDRDVCTGNLLDLMSERNLPYSDPADAAALDLMMMRLRGDLENAKRLLKIATYGTNRKLMKNLRREQQFYQRYMEIVLSCDSMENIWVTMRHLSPTKIQISFRLVDIFVNAAQKHNKPEYLPIIYTEIVLATKKGWSSVEHWMEVACDMYEQACADTRTQFKHIGLITLRRADRIQPGKTMANIVSACLELVARAEDPLRLRSAILDLTESDKLSKVLISSKALHYCEEAACHYPKIIKLVQKLARADRDAVSDVVSDLERELFDER